MIDVNMTVVTSLMQYYDDLPARDDCPDNLRSACRKTMPKFDRRLRQILDEFAMQKFRVDALLRIVKDRKTLVS